MCQEFQTLHALKSWWFIGEICSSKSCCQEWFKTNFNMLSWQIIWLEFCVYQGLYCICQELQTLYALKSWFFVWVATQTLFYKISYSDQKFFQNNLRPKQHYVFFCNFIKTLSEKQRSFCSRYSYRLCFTGLGLHVSDAHTWAAGGTSQDARTTIQFSQEPYLFG